MNVSAIIDRVISASGAADDSAFATAAACLLGNVLADERVLTNFAPAQIDLIADIIGDHLGKALGTDEIDAARVAPALEGEEELAQVEPAMAETPRHAVVYTDGACKINPGPGGWAVVIDESGQKTEFHGSELSTTNNRMEMLAVLKALQHTAGFASVEIMTDSKLVVETMSGNWKPKANLDLWREIFIAAESRNTKWTWVKGHNGHPGNSRADFLADRAARLAA